MYLYLLKCTTYIGTCYKIGKAKDVQRRIKQLQTGNPLEIELVCYRRFANVFEVESFLHYLFSSNRVRGEWFTLSQFQVIWVEGRVFNKRSLKYRLLFWLSSEVYLGRGL